MPVLSGTNHIQAKKHPTELLQTYRSNCRTVELFIHMTTPTYFYLKSA